MFKPKNLTEFLKLFPVVSPIKLRWGDMDSFKHINNVAYVRYQEAARISYIEAICDHIESKKDATEFINATGTGFILVDTYTKFKFPALYPDTFLVGTTILPEEITENRAKQHYLQWSVANNRVVSEGHAIIASFDYKVGKPCHFPDYIKNSMLKLSKLDSLKLEKDILQGKLPL